MNGIFLCNNAKQCEKKTFGGGRAERAGREFSMAPQVVTAKNLKEQAEAAGTAEIAFSTWGAPRLTREEIHTYLPNLKALFYAAGSVQDFARPFLEEGVRIFSAWGANAVPVAEYVFAQIILAQKGFFRSVRKTSWSRGGAFLQFAQYPGNFETSVGLIGAGMVGAMVAERLKTLDCKVFLYDPFLPQARAKELGATLVGDLPTLFRECDVISNHLANNEQTKGMINAACFSEMKPHAVFINTGRGAQVVERDLIRAMRQEKGRTALLDVTFPEPPHIFSGLNFCKNILLTPHMAGSSGREIWRMADAMLEQAILFRDGLPTQYEVTMEMLKTMA